MPPSGEDAMHAYPFGVRCAPSHAFVRPTPVPGRRQSHNSYTAVRCAASRMKPTLNWLHSSIDKSWRPRCDSGSRARMTHQKKSHPAIGGTRNGDLTSSEVCHMSQSTFIHCHVHDESTCHHRDATRHLTVRPKSSSRPLHHWCLKLNSVEYEPLFL